MKQLASSEDRNSARQLAARYRCEFVELKGTRLDLELFKSIQADLMFRYNFVPLRVENGALVVAMADPSDLVLIDEVSALLGRPLIIKVAPLSEIQDLLKNSESTGLSSKPWRPSRRNTIRRSFRASRSCRSWIFRSGACPRTDGSGPVIRAGPSTSAFQSCLRVSARTPSSEFWTRKRSAKSSVR